MENVLGQQLPAWMVLPFVGLLLCIATLPLAREEWFDRHHNKALVAAVFGVPVVAYLVLGYGRVGYDRVLSTGEDYVSFIVLLAALFTISGGIYLTGNLLGKPQTNLAFLLIGAVLANFIGTTGAAMVLVRPVLRANSERMRYRHVVIFLIFIVCNIGGLLTPLGDPPLFLGFLNGVSFFWTFRLWPEWLFTVGLTLAVFYALDTYYYRREPASSLRADVVDYEPLGIVGKVNFVFLAGVVGAVVASEPLLRAGEAVHFPFLRELVMLAMLALSLRYGPHEARRLNKFTWRPIREVAIVFAGIFAAMIPALAILEARGGELGLTQPWHFYWAAGGLSSFLDNAPTYLTFTSTAQGYLGIGSVAGLMSHHVAGTATSAPAAFLAAISCGSVMMGANSYIGNAPNFMVKTIAEEAGVNMPHFFGYMAYSAVVLIPIFIATTLVFFR
jgi:Na+/H+ antiporter NhaD/arsenite permease-like protein